MDYPKFCPHCGKPTEGQPQFCTACGKAVVALVSQPAPATPATPPAKKPASMVAYTLLVLILLGCYWIYAAGARGPRSSAAYTSSGYDVEYRISGSTSRVDLTYENSDGATEQKSDARVPWSLKFKGVSGQFLYISAQNQLSSGSVTCEIRLNGEVVKTATSNGEYVIASCSGKI